MEVGVSEKVLKYESFVNDTLKEDLKRVNEKQNSLNKHIAEYVQLKNVIETMMELGEDKPFKTKMDIGCNFYVKATVPDVSRILIDVGLGHYVEFTLSEALKFINKRIKILTHQTEKLRKDSASTKALIKLVLGGLHQLQIGEKSKQQPEEL